MTADLGARPLRVLELYCGIGGCAAALGSAAAVVAAVDQSRPALAVYQHNFTHPVVPKRIEDLDPHGLAGLAADLWWASPPCQPFTRRGLQRALDDPRTTSFRALLHCLEVGRPRYLALENVVGFAGSTAHRRLHATLAAAGYGEVLERHLCPSALGWPNRRPRFYLIAARDRLAAPRLEPVEQRRLAAFIESEAPPDLGLEADLAERYRYALDIVGAEDPEAITACFTSAYGRSPVRSGSYLRENGGLRRFSPGEILRLLGFAESFRLPAELPRSMAWRLAGNSLALGPVRAMLEAVPELHGRLVQTGCPSKPTSSAILASSSSGVAASTTKRR